MSDGEFSVWAFMPDETHFPIERWVDAELAMRSAHHAVGLADRLKGREIAVRVIVTDGGDHTVFEWKRDEGVTWPGRS